MTDEVKKRVATASRKATHHRNYRRARDRALARLAHLYPDTYKQLLEMEKKQDELQGKKWISIDGTTVLTVGVHTRATGADNLAYSSNAGADEGNNGGEA
jgi:GTP1/Obg family GTP-binding protein